jgi:hypothetical protein
MRRHSATRAPDHRAEEHLVPESRARMLLATSSLRGVGREPNATIPHGLFMCRQGMSWQEATLC